MGNTAAVSWPSGIFGHLLPSYSQSVFCGLQEKMPSSAVCWKFTMVPGVLELYTFHQFLLNLRHIETWKCKLCLFCSQCFLRQSWGFFLEDRRMLCMPGCIDRGWNSLRKGIKCLEREPKSGKGVTMKDRNRWETFCTKIITRVRTQTSAYFVGLVEALYYYFFWLVLHNDSCRHL